MNTKSNNDIFCLFLMGGKSSRIKFDKFNIKYDFFSYWKYCYKILSCYLKTYLSLNFSNKNFFYFNKYNFLTDIFGNNFGPISGILSSIKFNSSVSWFIVSCDFVFLNKEIIEFFLSKRDLKCEINVLYNKNTPEPLFAIYETSCYKKLFDFFFNGYNCLKTFISRSNVNYIKSNNFFFNINSFNDLNYFFSFRIIIKVLYFSLFKDYSLKNFEYFYFFNSITLLQILLIIIKKYKINVEVGYLKFIVNNELKNSEYKIKNNDVVLFLLPVSGG